MLTFNNLIQENKYIDPKDVDRGWGGLAGRIGGGALGAGLGSMFAGPAGSLVGAGLGIGLGSYVGGSVAGDMSDRKKLDKDKIYDRMGYLMAPHTDGVGSLLSGAVVVPKVGKFLGISGNMRSLDNAEKLGYRSDTLGTLGQGLFGGLRGIVTPPKK